MSCSMAQTFSLFMFLSVSCVVLCGSGCALGTCLLSCYVTVVSRYVHVYALSCGSGANLAVAPEGICVFVSAIKSTATTAFPVWAVTSRLQEVHGAQQLEGVPPAAMDPSFIHNSGEHSSVTLIVSPMQPSDVKQHLWKGTKCIFLFQRLVGFRAMARTRISRRLFARRPPRCARRSIP